MFRLLILCALISTGLCKFRIVNGTPGKIEDFPYLVSLQHRGIVRCGASIYNERTIITAAHCLQDVILEKLSVRAGTAIGERGGTVIPVLKYVNHPQYSRLIQNNDIAVVFLKEPLTYSDVIKPIKLAKSGDELPYGKLGTVAGWGRISEKGGFPDNFHFVQLPVLKREQCITSGGGGYEPFRVTDKMFCAGFLEGGKDSCKSDSGGPFVVGDTLIGVVSFGQGCARPKFPGVYANVAVLRSWIDEVISENQ